MSVGSGYNGVGRAVTVTAGSTTSPSGGSGGAISLTAGSTGTATGGDAFLLMEPEGGL